MNGKIYLQSKVLVIMLLLLLANKLSAKDYRAQVLSNLYEQLIETKGKRSPLSVPVLQLIDSDDQSAAFKPDYNKIEFSTKLYKLCSQLGEDSLKAMAFVLAHELVHFYENHGLSKLGFIPFKVMTKGEVEEEREADIKGAFWAYLAGYYPKNVVPRLIDALYEEYNLEDQLENYPSKRERRRAAMDAQKTVAQLVAAFETANYLNAYGEFELALPLYLYIDRYFQSPEIATNVSLLRLQDALAMQTSSPRFYYPFMLENDFRLYHLPDKSKYEIAKLLENGAYWATNALKMDSCYFPALLQEANIYCLMATQGMCSVEKAKEKIDAANRLPQEEQHKAALLLLEGILYQYTGDDSLAISQFTEAKNKGEGSHLSRLADKNLRLLKENTVRILPKIKYVYKPQLEVSYEHCFGIVSGFEFCYKEAIYFEVRQSEPFHLESRYVILRQKNTSHPFAVLIGKDLEAVLAKKGMPSYALAATNGLYYVYEQEAVILYFSPEGKLVECADFH